MRHIEALEARIQWDGGDPDPSFGQDGSVTLDYDAVLGEAWRPQAFRFTQDAGGRIYAFSMQREFADDNLTVVDRKLVIARYTRDGQLDPRFGENGIKLLDRNPASVAPVGASDREPKVLVDPTNRVHVLDGSILWRLTPGGKADQTFGRRGKIIIPFLIESATTAPNDVAFDAAGRAYVAGSTQGKTGTRMTVLRLTESGVLDESWGLQGAYKSPVRVPGAQSSARLLKFLDDGKLIVAGRFAPPGVSSGLVGAWLMRLLPDGSVDTTYGTDGYAETSGEITEVTANSPVATNITPDGTVYGYTASSLLDFPGPGGLSGLNWRIPADGSPAVSQPIVPGSFREDFDHVGFAQQFLVQPDGKILARGPEQENIFRVDAAGALDSTWGGDGIVQGEQAGLGGMQLAPDGSILAQGGLDDNVFKLFRMFRDDAPLTQFDGRQIRAPRTTANRFAITFRDDDGIDSDSLDSADVKVSGPFDGQPKTRSATLEDVESLGGGRYRATYRVTSPGGWTAADNGLFSVRLIRGEVEDVNGIAAAAGIVGTFSVRIA